MTLSERQRREWALRELTPATLRALALHLGKPFPTPRTAAARREVIAWILDAEETSLAGPIVYPDDDADRKGFGR